MTLQSRSMITLCVGFIFLVAHVCEAGAKRPQPKSGFFSELVGKQSTRTRAAGWNPVDQGTGPSPFTIDTAFFRFHTTADCSGGFVQHVVNGDGYTFTSGDPVYYSGASAWAQMVDAAVDPTTIQSMGFMFCGEGGRCTEGGGLKCFTETCAMGECVTATAITPGSMS